MNNYYSTDWAATPETTGTKEPDTNYWGNSAVLTAQSTTPAPNLQFADRVVPYPGRVKLIKVSGQGDDTIYDVVRCEGTPAAEGTRLNAATMNGVYEEAKIAREDADTLKKALENIKITAQKVESYVAPSGSASIDFTNSQLNMNLNIPKGEPAVIYNGSQACSAIKFELTGTTLTITTTPKV